MSFCHFYKEEQLLRLTGCFLEQRGPTINIALDKREYLMIMQHIFSYFSMKLYAVTPHLNRLVETVQMMGHNTDF